MASKTSKKVQILHFTVFMHHLLYFNHTDSESGQDLEQDSSSYHLSLEPGDFMWKHSRIAAFDSGLSSCNCGKCLSLPT